MHRKTMIRDELPVIMLRIPSSNRRLRWLMIAYGLMLFLWFTPEDNQAWPVALLGLGLAALVVGLQMIKRWGGTAIPWRYAVPGAVAVGALTGLGTSITTAGLMFFKNAMHAHGFVDFPTPMLLAILERAPAWGLAGGLIGLGATLACLTVGQDGYESGHDYH